VISCCSHASTTWQQLSSRAVPATCVLIRNSWNHVAISWLVVPGQPPVFIMLRNSLDHLANSWLIVPGQPLNYYQHQLGPRGNSWLVMQGHQPVWTTWQTAGQLKWAPAADWAKKNTVIWTGPCKIKNQTSDGGEGAVKRSLPNYLFCGCWACQVVTWQLTRRAPLAARGWGGDLFEAWHYHEESPTVYLINLVPLKRKKMLVNCSQNGFHLCSH
jgi:hypothetical protein